MFLIIADSVKVNELYARLDCLSVSENFQRWLSEGNSVVTFGLFLHIERTKKICYWRKLGLFLSWVWWLYLAALSGKYWSSFYTIALYSVKNLQNPKLSQLMRLWYLSHRRPAKAQASLRICAVSPEPSQFAHREYGSSRRVRPKIRHLAPLDGCAYAFEERVYGGRKVS